MRTPEPGGYSRREKSSQDSCKCTYEMSPKKEEVMRDSRLVIVSSRRFSAAGAAIGAMLAATASVSFAMPPASSVSAQDGWRVIGRGTDSGDQVAVASAAKRRTTKLAVRVRVTGLPNTAELHTVVTCSKAGYFGIGVFSRRDKFRVTAPAFRVLRLPIAYPENCGVTVIGTSTTHAGRITVEILAPCIVQTNGALKGVCA